MKISRVLLVSLLVGLWWCGTAGAAAPGSPTEQVKETVDKVIETLKNKELKKPSKAEERRAILRRTVGDRFDFEEMSKRTLSIHWQRRTPEERKEFVSLFSDLLERTYVNKIESYTDEKVVYGDESIEGDYAVVKTKIITSANVEVPIDYKLFKKSPKWVAYDVVIEGVSLVNNYRTQFNKIIRSQSYEELVKRLRAKQEKPLFEEKKK